VLQGLRALSTLHCWPGRPRVQGMRCGWGEGLGESGCCAAACIREASVRAWSSALAYLQRCGCKLCKCMFTALKHHLHYPAQVRAKRRYDELLRRGITASYDAVLADMNERDKRDSSRATAPLKPAEDAFLLDTSEMDAAHALAAAKAYVSEKLAAASGPGQE
jgi:hypothetical protein